MCAIYLNKPTASAYSAYTDYTYMPEVRLNLRPIPPIYDPCSKVEDRPFTQQEIARALADLLDFIEEQQVFQTNTSGIHQLQAAPITIPTDTE